MPLPSVKTSSANPGCQIMRGKKISDGISLLDDSLSQCIISEAMIPKLIHKTSILWFIKRGPGMNTFEKRWCMLFSLAEASCRTLCVWGGELVLGEELCGLCYFVVPSLGPRRWDLQGGGRSASESFLQGSFLGLISVYKISAMLSCLA